MLSQTNAPLSFSRSLAFEHILGKKFAYLNIRNTKRYRRDMSIIAAVGSGNSPSLINTLCNCLPYVFTIVAKITLVDVTMKIGIQCGTSCATLNNIPIFFSFTLECVVCVCMCVLCVCICVYRRGRDP